MSKELILTNAAIVTADDVIRGTVHAVCGQIRDISEKRSNAPGAIDFEGDYLMPGLIELHTDNLEKNFTPRPGVAWPAAVAALAHDAQLASSGITTVCDALCVGDLSSRSKRLLHLDDMAEAIRKGIEHGAFRAEHLIHLRCELSYEGVVDLFQTFQHEPKVRLVSLMDHTPGQRQFVSMEAYKRYFQGKYGMSDDELDTFVKVQTAAHHKYSAKHRKIIVDMCRDRGWPIASHDDATTDHVHEARDNGAVVAEFPTTMDAAHAARQHDLKVLMGAPNIVLGGSHSGNVSALDLAQEGLLDILSSDYVPSSLIQAVFLLKNANIGVSLPEATAKVTQFPAEVLGLDDRGVLAPGKRADLIRVRETGSFAVVSSIWRSGHRVA